MDKAPKQEDHVS